MLGFSFLGNKLLHQGSHSSHQHAFPVNQILKTKIFLDLISAESSSLTETYVKNLHSDEEMEVAVFVLLD